MEALLVIALLIGLGLLATVVIAEHRQRDVCIVREITFGRQTDSVAVLSLLGLLAGMTPGKTLALEVRADHRGIRHLVEADQATMDTLEGQLRAVLPGVRLIHQQAKRPPVSLGRRLVLRPADGVLHQDDSASSAAALLAAMQPLREGEAIVLRWLIAPAVATRLFDEPDPHGRRSKDYWKLLRAKHHGPVLHAVGLLAAAAGHPKRAEHLLGRTSVAIRARGGIHGRLDLRPLTEDGIARALRRRRIAGQAIFSPAELAPLIGWPLDGRALPGLTRGTAPLLLPSGRIPTSGRRFGRATWPGAARDVAQPVEGGLSHCLIAGPTGVGKSALMTNLICDDMQAGRGLLVIDGKGDLASDVLARLPTNRSGDVVVLDCAWDGPVPGLRLFGGGVPELEADLVLGVLADLFRDSWGPLSERYLRAGLQAVAHDPGSTLADVPFVFSDPAYRRRLVGQLQDPLTAGVFSSFEAMTAAEQAHVVAAPLNKLTALLGRPTIRAIVGQSNPSLDFAGVLGTRKIVVVSLAPTRIGAPAGRLVAALIVFQFFAAVQGRATRPLSARQPFFVYLDEPKALGDLPMPIDGLLDQARGLGVGVVIAPQSVGQLGASLRSAVLTNAATRIVFRQDSDDARLLARDLRGVTAEELGDLGQFEAVARIGLGPGDIAPPVTIKTLPKPDAVQSPQLVRQTAGRNYGVDPQTVTDALMARHRAERPSDAPVGRTRRAS